MCIRDRYLAQRQAQQEAGARRQAQPARPEPAGVLAAVSYTHLTDTKTDDESSISSLLDAPLFDDNGLLAAPVSYTHLDVYKRQGQTGGSYEFQK